MAPPPLRLLCVTSHPDDETLGFGGTLARAAAEGVETFVIAATLGERGRIGTERPGPAIVAPVRERELRAACAVLGVRELHLLGYLDGEVDRVDAFEATARLAALVRRIRPQVVATFGAEGGYGHPDHIAVSQLTGAALVVAADGSVELAGPAGEPLAPHAADKLYWLAWDEEVWAAYHAAFGDLVARVDGIERRAAPWPAWAVTTIVDTHEHRDTIWRAAACHHSQLSGYARLTELPEKLRAGIWDRQTYYRVWSRVGFRRELETDLFAGLRK